MVHTTLGATPMQLLFGQDDILNMSHDAKWQLIKLRKQELINKNNQKENKSVSTHVYPGQAGFNKK